MQIQVKEVGEFLLNRGSITPLQAWVELGVYRLSDCIFKLRKVGVDVETVMVKADNGKRYARYVLD